MRPTRPIPALLLLVVSLLVTVGAQEKPKHEEPPPEVPLAQWLAAGDHMDFRAEFKVMKPRLTYQQRLLVECRATISGEIARGRDFHMWMKVADRSGAWLPGHDYTHSAGAGALTRSNEMQMVAGFYAQPGQYTVAIIIYDAGTHQYDIRHLPLTVEALKNDSLAAQSATDEPAVEFLEQPPPAGDTFEHIADLSPRQTDSEWQFSKYGAILPLAATRRPLQIDVVLDFTDHGEVEKTDTEDELRSYNDRRLPPWERRERPRGLRAEQAVVRGPAEYIADLLAIGHTLAKLQPANGCVRFSGIDMTAMNAGFRRVAPDKMDWEELRKAQTPAKGGGVSVAALKNRKEQPLFLRDFLKGLEAPIDSCGSSAVAPLHAVLFVSHRFLFPRGSHKEPFRAANPADYRLFYWQLNEGNREHGDDLESYLKSSEAQVHGFEEPHRFREILAHTLAEIVTAAGK